MSTYAITVTGPSTRLSWLRALIRKIATTGRQLWEHARQLITGTARLGHALASSTLSLIGTPAGYTALTNGLRRLVTTGWQALTATVRWIGTRLHTIGRHLHHAVATVSPRLAQGLTRLAARVAHPVHAFGSRLESAVEATGRLAWWLTGTDLVRDTTTRAAQAATLLIGAHLITSGALAAKLVAALPWTMDAVIAVTNPVKALGFVAATAGISMGIALIRLLRTAQGDEPTPTTPAAAMAVPIRPGAEDQEQEVLTDLAVIARSISIHVQTDGSITVAGIPDTVPADLGQAVAEIAIDAATRQLERTLRLRPSPTRDDRRLFTKAARGAIRAEAQRRKGNAA